MKWRSLSLNIGTGGSRGKGVPLTQISKGQFTKIAPKVRAILAFLTVKCPLVAKYGITGGGRRQGVGYLPPLLSRPYKITKIVKNNLTKGSDDNEIMRKFEYPGKFCMVK